MKQSLQLKISQQLTMTPQLQQAIRLLQLSTVDLQQEIQTMVESNPMLELPDEPDANFDADNITTPELNNAGENEPKTIDEQPNYEQELIPSDLPVDSHWEDVYPSQPAPASNQTTSGDDIDTRNAEQATLQDHLLWQLNLTTMSDTDRIIGLAIIDAVNPTGYLSTTAEEIHQGLSQSLEIDLDEIVAVLHLIQHFDPLGVAAIDLQDCLLIQLQQLPADTPLLAQARKVVKDHLPALGSRDFPMLKRRLRLKDDQLAQVIALIQSLQPRPGEIISSNPVEYVTPDVYVRKINGRWSVELNPDIAPRLQINAMYASLVKRADNNPDNNYMRDSLLEARWFLKSL